jgi:hypothetical protein
MSIVVENSMEIFAVILTPILSIIQYTDMKIRWVYAFTLFLKNII